MSSRWMLVLVVAALSTGCDEFSNVGGKIVRAVTFWKDLPEARDASPALRQGPGNENHQEIPLSQVIFYRLNVLKSTQDKTLSEMQVGYQHSLAELVFSNRLENLAELVEQAQELIDSGQDELALAKLTELESALGGYQDIVTQFSPYEKVSSTGLNYPWDSHKRPYENASFLTSHYHLDWTRFDEYIGNNVQSIRSFLSGSDLDEFNAVFDKLVLIRKKQEVLINLIAEEKENYLGSYARYLDSGLGVDHSQMMFGAWLSHYVQVAAGELQTDFTGAFEEMNIIMERNYEANKERDLATFNQQAANDFSGDPQIKGNYLDAVAASKGLDLSMQQSTLFAYQEYQRDTFENETEYMPTDSVRFENDHVQVRCGDSWRNLRRPNRPFVRSMDKEILKVSIPHSIWGDAITNDNWPGYSGRYRHIDLRSLMLLISYGKINIPRGDLEFVRPKKIKFAWADQFNDLEEVQKAKVVYRIRCRGASEVSFEPTNLIGIFQENGQEYPHRFLYTHILSNLTGYNHIAAVGSMPPNNAPSFSFYMHRNLDRGGVLEAIRPFAHETEHNLGVHHLYIHGSREPDLSSPVTPGLLDIVGYNAFSFNRASEIREFNSFNHFQRNGRVIHHMQTIDTPGEYTVRLSGVDFIAGIDINDPMIYKMTFGDNVYLLSFRTNKLTSHPLHIDSYKFGVSTHQALDEAYVDGLIIYKAHATNNIRNSFLTRVPGWMRFQTRIDDHFDVTIKDVNWQDMTLTFQVSF